MGSSWSWPCADRERKHFKVKTTNIQKKNNLPQQESPNITMARFQVNIVPQERLEKTLRACNTELRPSYILPHPLNPQEALIFLQLPADLATFEFQSGHYSVVPFAFSRGSPKQWRKTLKNWILNSYEAGEVAIGFKRDSSDGLFICNYKYDDNTEMTSRFKVMELTPPLSVEALNGVLNENPELRFRVLIEYREAALLVMERPQTPKTSQYFVTEYPRQKIGSKSLSSKLGLYIEKALDQELAFEGGITFAGSLFFVFSRN